MSALTGRVAVFVGARKPLEIREYPVPDPPPGGAILRIRRANLCGSDMHFWRGNAPVPVEREVVLGHEAVATIEKLGEGLTTDDLGQPLAEGDRIAFSYFRFCGKCWPCLSGKSACPNRNEYWLGLGADEPPHFHGTFCDYRYLRPGHWIFKVPDELPDNLVSPVNCALSQVIYGLDRTHVTLGDTVLIQGAGGLGLYAVAAAKEMGAANVVIMDRLADRLALAREFGADLALNVDETSAAERKEQILDLTGGRGADLALELVGHPGVIPEGIDLLRDGGNYVLIGNVGPGRTVEIDPALLVRPMKTVLPIIAYEHWVLPRALDFLARTQDRYPYHKLVSHTFPFEQINEAFELTEAGGCIRASLEFDQ